MQQNIHLTNPLTFCSDNPNNNSSFALFQKALSQEINKFSLIIREKLFASLDQMLK